MPYVQFPEGTPVSAQVQGLIEDAVKRAVRPWQQRTQKLKKRLKQQEQITIEWQQYADSLEN
jgi:hypothetical protein